MYYDTFDTGLGMTPGFDSLGGGFGMPMFNGSGCFPMPSFDMNFNGSFSPMYDTGMGLPITCGYSPTPFGCNPVSMDLSGNVCVDGIPITPSTPPAWMTARAAQAELHLNQLEMQLNDSNFWMNLIPQSAFNMPPFAPIDTSGMDWTSADPTPPVLCSGEFPMMSDPMMGMTQPIGLDMNPGNGMEPSVTSMWKGEEVLPCGLTQSQYDQNLSKYQALLADCERQLENCDPYHSAQRAMIQNNIDRINRNIRDLDKPIGKI